jgi:prepilin-type N-terminal cleavage/methylation domain-containing protein
MRKLPSDQISSKGFTLLELLLVVVILSSMAWMLTGTRENNVGQVRYEDTRNRLDAIRETVLGPSSSATWERGIQSGYVVDNGVLPETINALVTPVVDDSLVPVLEYDAFALVAPVFDPTPDVNGVNDDSGDEVDLDEDTQILMKGHRGSYVPATSSGKFRDGWGTVSDDSDDDDENHGWELTLTHDGSNVIGFDVSSYGMDGVVGTLIGSPYEEDLPMSSPVVSGDWQVDVSGRSVKLVNLSGEDLDFSASNASISLLVYENSLSGGQWRRLTTDTIDACLDGDGDGICGTDTAASRETTVVFQTVISPASNLVPTGEHLLVLVSDKDGVAFSSDDEPDLSTIDWPPSSHWPGSSSFVNSRIKFFSRGGVPDMVLEIR